MSLLAGNLRAYEEDRLGFLLDVRRQFGPLAAFDARTTIVSDPELAGQILRDRARVYDVSHNFMGQRIDETNSNEIVEVRRLLNPGLRANAVVGMGEQVGRLATKHLSVKPSSPTQVLDPMALAESVISEAVGRHVLGDAYDHLGHLVRELLDALEGVIGNVFALPTAFKTPARRRIVRRYERLRSGIGDLLAAEGTKSPALADEGGSSPLLARIAARRSSVPEGRLADLVIGALLAAQRVPAAGAGWLLMLLADHPDVQQHVRAEASSRRGDPQRPPTIVHMPYATAVVMEALRLYPPTWLMARIARRPVQLGGYEFGADHTFILSPYVLHRDPAVTEQPESFVPQRWVERDRAPKYYFTFGAGLHRCPGADASVASLVGLASTLVSSHVLTRVGEVRANPRTSLRPDGLALRLTPLHASARPSVRPTEASTPTRPLALAEGARA